MDDVEKILDEISNILFPGYKEIDFEKIEDKKQRLQIVVWQFLRGHINSSVTNVMFKEKFRGKTGISDNFEIVQNETTLTKNIYGYIRRGIIVPLRKHLLTKKTPIAVHTPMALVSHLF